MKLKPPSRKIILRLLSEEESAPLNRAATTLAIPDKHDRYANQMHTPDLLRIAEVLAVGVRARAWFDEPLQRGSRVAVHFAVGEPLAVPNQRLVEPEQILAVIE